MLEFTSKDAQSSVASPAARSSTRGLASLGALTVLVAGAPAGSSMSGLSRTSTRGSSSATSGSTMQTPSVATSRRSADVRPPCRGRGARAGEGPPARSSRRASGASPRPLPCGDGRTAPRTRRAHHRGRRRRSIMTTRTRGRRGLHDEVGKDDEDGEDDEDDEDEAQDGDEARGEESNEEDEENGADSDERRETRRTRRARRARKARRRRRRRRRMRNRRSRRRSKNC